jgi:hypothetical protein
MSVRDFVVNKQKKNPIVETDPCGSSSSRFLWRYMSVFCIFVTKSILIDVFSFV